MNTAAIIEELQALRSEITALKSSQVTQRAGTVVTVDPTTATFTAELPDGQLIDLAAPPHFLPAVGDEVSMQVNGATPEYQPARVAADSITLTELDPDVVSQIESGGTTYFTAPTPPAYSGAADTAFWIDSSAGGGYLNHRWDGAQWVGLPLGPAAFQAGAVTATVLAATAVDGKTITGALIRTAASGQRVELSSANGMVGYDSAGTAITQISPADGSLVAVNATITGQIRTATSGARAVLSEAASQLISYYSLDVGAMASTTLTNVGSLQFFGSSTTTDVPTLVAGSTSQGGYLVSLKAGKVGTTDLPAITLNGGGTGTSTLTKRIVTVANVERVQISPPTGVTSAQLVVDGDIFANYVSANARATMFKGVSLSTTQDISLTVADGIAPLQIGTDSSNQVIFDNNEVFVRVWNGSAWALSSWGINASAVTVSNDLRVTTMGTATTSVVNKAYVDALGYLTQTTVGADGSVSGGTFVNARTASVTVPSGIPSGSRLKVTGVVFISTPSGVGAVVAMDSLQTRSLNQGGINGDVVVTGWDTDLTPGARSYSLQVHSTTSGTVTFRQPYFTVEVVR